MNQHKTPITLETIGKVPVREAIRMILKKAYIAKITGNRELVVACRYWLQEHIPQRNTNRYIFFKHTA